jgi:hypothetical protein
LTGSLEQEFSPRAHLLTLQLTQRQHKFSGTFLNQAFPKDRLFKMG